MNDFSGKKAWFSSSVSAFCKKVWLNRGGQIVDDILCADFIFGKNPEAKDIEWFFNSEVYLEDGVLPFKSEWLRNPSQNILDFVLYPKDFEKTIFPNEWNFEDEHGSPQHLHLSDFRNAKQRSARTTLTSLDTPPISPSQFKLNESETSPSIPKEQSSETSALSVRKPPVITIRSSEFKRRKNLRMSSRATEMEDNNSESRSPKVNARRSLRMELPVKATQHDMEMEEKSSESELGYVVEETPIKESNKSKSSLTTPVAATQRGMEEKSSESELGYVVEDTPIKESNKSKSSLTTPVKATQTGMEEKSSESALGYVVEDTPIKESNKSNSRLTTPVAATQTGMEEKSSESELAHIVEDIAIKELTKFSTSRLLSPVEATLHELEVQNYEFHSSMHDGFVHLEDLRIPEGFHLEDFLLSGKGTDYQVFLKHPP